MAKPPKSTENVTPPSLPSVTPSELYSSQDIRIVMMKLGEIGTQVADLRDGQKTISASQAQIDRKLTQFETTIKVAGIGLTLFFAFFWFMFGGDIRSLRDLAP